MKLDKCSGKASISQQPTFMLNVTPAEALVLIKSLAEQIYTKNCNSGRAEFTTEEGEYFSIAVLDPK